MNCSFADRQYWSEFIDIYRNHECLWRIKSKQYMDRNKKDAAYEVLMDKLQERDSEATVETVKKRINNMRSVFRKETKKVNASILSGATGDDVYSPRLWYYNMLLFLKDQEFPKASLASSIYNVDEEHELPKSSISSSVSNVDEDATLDDDMQLPSADYCQTELVSSDISRPSSPAAPLYRNPKRIKKSANVSPNEFLLSVIGERIANIRQEDEFDAIGSNVATKLRKMKPNMQLIAEKLINDVLYEGMTESLKTNTKLATPEPTTSLPHPFQELTNNSLFPMLQLLSSSIAKSKNELGSTDRNMNP